MYTITRCIHLTRSEQMNSLTPKQSATTTRNICRISYVMLELQTQLDKTKIVTASSPKLETRHTHTSTTIHQWHITWLELSLFYRIRRAGLRHLSSSVLIIHPGPTVKTPVATTPKPSLSSSHSLTALYHHNNLRIYLRMRHITKTTTMPLGTFVPMDGPIQEVGSSSASSIDGIPSTLLFLLLCLAVAMSTVWSFAKRIVGVGCVNGTEAGTFPPHMFTQFCRM